MAVLPTGIGPVTGYNIERSLRFNSADSAYLNRTPASAGNRKTWTWSGWVKRSALGSAEYLFTAGTGGTDTTQQGLNFQADNTLRWTGSATPYLVTTQVFRDPSAWYHVVFVFDTTQATANNRQRIYVNGVEITAFSTQVNPTQNLDYAVNQAAAFNIGRWTGASNYFNGYMTEVNFVDSPVLVGSTTNASTTITLTTGTTANIGIGWNVGGTNIPSGATVSSITNSTQFVISSAATGTGSSINIGVTPPVSAFGETDTNTGVWKPKAYSGTYGTNGFYLPFKTASQWSGYFDGTGDYASFSPTSALNAGTGDFTLEFWTFHLTSSTYQGYYYGGATGSINFRRTSSNTIELAHDGVTSVLITSTTIPANQWVHVAVTRNSGTVRIFINGVSGGSVTYTGNFSSTGGTGTIGSITPSIYNLNGYISNLRLITGTALYTANFTPPTAQLTAVSGTQLLTCQSSTFVDNSTNAFTITAAGDARPQQFSPFTLDVTDDHSGQGNHWIPNNLDLRTTGVGADILVDSPTNYGSDTGAGGEVRGNYCTLNPLYPSGGTRTFANGNLEVTGGALNANSTELANWQLTTGKWYFEGTVGAIGLASITQIGTSVATYYGNGTFFPSGSGASYTTNDVIGVAADIDAGTVQFYKNGVSQGTVTGTAGTASFPAFALGGNATPPKWIVNFGQRPFEKWNGSAYVANTAPSGFKALCTQNLPPVTIGATSTTQANKYMDVTLYTGNATARSITNSGSMQPDFVWDKLRSGANSHRLFDAVRGVEKALYSNLTNIEATETGTLTAFNSNGFSLGTNNETNTNGSTYVAWQWNAGGSNQTISVGQYATSPANVPSIASTVRANTTSGFSIVTFTTNNTAGATVGHGCQVGGVATTPDMIIMKYRGLAANWVVYHKSMNATPQNGYLNLNTTAPYAALIDPWNNTAPSSTVITMGAGAGSAGSTNYSVYTSVAYCFAAVPGYSAFGSYAGNGTTTGDGPFIYTGFKPAFVMLKAYIGSGENWAIYDKSRIEYNSSNYVLFPNLTNVENAATTHIDLLSNGFKLRSGNQNLSSYSYIYAAFAESPFKYSLAR